MFEHRSAYYRNGYDPVKIDFSAVFFCLSPPHDRRLPKLPAGSVLGGWKKFQEYFYSLSNCDVSSQTELKDATLSNLYVNRTLCMVSNFRMRGRMSPEFVPSERLKETGPPVEVCIFKYTFSGPYLAPPS